MSEHCECKKPMYIDLPAEHFCSICNKSVWLKKELPEKIDNNVCYNRLFILQKINEIIDYLKEN